MRQLRVRLPLLVTAVGSFVFLPALGAAQALEDPIPDPIPTGTVTVALQQVASGLAAPNWGTHAEDGSGRLFFADQPGFVYELDLGSGGKRIFLDASDRLVALAGFDERGLLGIAFHPDYAANGLLYTYTSEPDTGAADCTVGLPAGVDPDHQSVITEWRVPEPTDPVSVVDPASARTLMRIDQPQRNHNGGALVFGSDEFLYIALGDGGGGDDQAVGHGETGNGQDPNNVLGAILRIDVDGANSANGQYGIPASNPFVGKVPIDEIFAFGFRNPFRISFDRVTGQLYIGDVGQNDIEEVDLGVPEGNYGWNLKEGSFFFDANGGGPGFVTDVDPGVPPGLIDPVAEYDHDEGNSVIGGFVYRGDALPDLLGRYVFGDFSGRLFYLDGTDAIQEFPMADPLAPGLRLLGFGQDAEGEIYVMANETARPSGETGVVLKIVDPDPDGDGIPNDGDGSRFIGDAPCAIGESAGCDDNCPNVANAEQVDSDGNGLGDVCQCGDVNGDGVTNVTDALMIARGQVGSDDPNLGRCDVSGDGFCNVTDALTIARGQVGSMPDDQLCPAYAGSWFAPR
jgi:glucose/arabinose dehydrogenase